MKARLAGMKLRKKYIGQVVGRGSDGHGCYIHGRVVDTKIVKGKGFVKIAVPRFGTDIWVGVDTVSIIPVE